jgi:tRNA(His) 5'-end guanylyltransferase
MGNFKDAMGERMKSYYESVPKIKLMRREPVIIRIDGKAFHTFTRGFEKPFDEVLMKTMQQTTKYLCENIQGCVLGYTQSDEISLVLIDYKELNTSAWFDNEVQKICSISASMATMAFNKYFAENVKNDKTIYEDDKVVKRHKAAVEKGAMFDSRCFNIPKEEVTNYIYWRQADASRNSIQMVGQANFSNKELHKKSRADIQDMLMLQKGINWNNYTTSQKRGTCVVRNSITLETFEDGRVHAELRYPEEKESAWIIDTEIPIFKGTDREYIEKLIYFEN